LKKYTLASFLLFWGWCVFGQQFQPVSSDQIYIKLEKLGVLGNAMYLAAHPDDENTRMISYLTNEKHFKTTYLSLTRGDGGQNLIGTELGAPLGVLRTHELLKARSVDGGQQWFTRANDFGFSKHPDETMRFWNEAEVLKDMVHAIRKFRPDIIINRFSTKNIGETHGHHSASAILADKAVVLAADPGYAIEGSLYSPWSVTNMYCNTSSFFYKTKEEFEKADKSGLYKVDCGTYFPLIGMSNGEIAAKSRSMHRCQGFGSAYSRGSSVEYLELLTGQAPADKWAPFAGINTSWTRVSGGAEIKAKLDDILSSFDFRQPARSLPALIETAQLIKKLKDSFWQQQKLEEINSIILDCAAFYMEAVTDQVVVCPGDSLRVDMEYITRNAVDVSLRSLSLMGVDYRSGFQELTGNMDQKESFMIRVPDATPLTTPYWLKGKFAPMMYDVRDREMIGMPDNNNALNGKATLSILGYEMTVPVQILYKNVNPAFGQKYDQVQVVPPVTVNLNGNTVVAKDKGTTDIHCTVKASKAGVAGTLYPELPKGWRSVPEFYQVDLKLKDEVKDFHFAIQGPAFAGIDSIGAYVISGGKKYSRGYEEIRYEHVPFRVLNIPNKVPMSVIRPVVNRDAIGYIAGAGDLVYESLKDVGYNISLIDPSQFSADNFKKYRSILVGIRAFNVLDNAAILDRALNEYTEQGGHVIVQYNTSNNLKIRQFGPYPLTLGRTRVTDELATVTFLEPQHPLLNKPNKITQADFDHWVQERGVYFGDKYDNNYQALLGMHDKNEPEAKGSLLYARYGKGTYIYTGLVFYRELPAGVPGAYRLMENLLSQ